MEGLTYPWITPVLDRLPRRARALPRALLLTGRPGLGKRATALFLAQSLLCETDRDALQACGTCVSCRLYQAGNHPDLRILEVGQEEEAPASGAADDEAGPSRKASRQISVENAVLKVLEEPPGETYFLLVSHQPERLLPTIRSRCFHLAFALPEAKPALDWLKGQGIAQGELALAQGGYAPLGAMGRAGDEAFWAQRKLLLDSLGAPAFDALYAAGFAEDIEGALVSTLLSQWAYDVVALQSGGKVRYHLDYEVSLQKTARAAPAEEFMRWYDAIIQFGRVAQHPLNKRLSMENLLSGYPGR